MKTLKAILLSAAISVTMVASAQTADEVINKHIAAMGGADKLSSLKTVRMEGNLNTQGVEVALTLTKKHLVGMRVDMEIMGTSNYQIVNATKGWAFMPVMQQTEPQEMKPDQLKSAQGQLDLQGSLFNYKQKGYTAEYVGLEKVDGKDAHKLKVVKEGRDVMYFVDATSGFILKTASKATIQGQEMDIQTTYADYKQTPDGFWFPFSSTTLQGPMSFSKIEVNVLVDEKIFTN